MSYSPQRVDTTNDGAANPSFYASDISAFPPLLVNGNYFWILYDSFNGFWEVLKSPDLVNWTVLHQSSPIFTIGWNFYTNGTIIHVCMENNNIGGLDFLSYDCSTDTFHDLYGNTGSPGISPHGLGVDNSDGSHFVLVTNLPNATIVPSYYKYDQVGNAWTGPFSLTTNVVGPVSAYTSGGIRGGYEESNGLFHVAFTYQDTAVPAKLHLFYQALNSNGTLGTFHDFGAGQTGQLANDFKVFVDETDNNVVISFQDSTDVPAAFLILYGTPLNAPVFSAITTIENIANASAPYLQVLSDGNLYAVSYAPTQNQVWYWKTTNRANPIAGWNTHTIIFDGSQTTVAGWQQNSLFTPILQLFKGAVVPFFGNPDPTNTLLLEYGVGLAGATLGPNQIIPPPEPTVLPDPCCVHELEGKYCNNLYYSIEEMRFD